MLDIIKSIVEKFLDLETNITDYEKMENKYKISRKKFIIMAFSLLLLISFNSSIAFFLTQDYARYQSQAFFGSLLLVVVLAIIVGRNHVKKVAMVIAYIILPVTLSILVIELYLEGFNIFNLCFIILLLSFILLMYSSSYIFVRDKLTMGEPVELTFIIGDIADPLTAKLISITKSGDYIVKLEGEEGQEILLNKDFIKQVIYDKSKE